MKNTGFNRAVAALAAVAHRFDGDAAHEAKQRTLKLVHRTALQDSPALTRYHDLLLFLLAHPSDQTMVDLIETEIVRLEQFLRKTRGRHSKYLQNQGLPWVNMVMSFSHDATRWLLDHPHCKIDIDSFSDEAPADLNAILKLTLSTAEHSETTMGLENDTLLDSLGVRKNQRLRFIVNEIDRFDPRPYLKDHLYESLGLFSLLTPTNKQFSKAFNRLPMRGQPYWQRKLLRDYDPRQLIEMPLPAPRNLRNRKALEEMIRVIQNTMILTCRETDPATYLDPRTLRVVDLEHGLTVAVFSMTPKRQLALESYVGFTLFKNGLAAAYGGAWLLGPRAAFGMNIFEPYRGGESGFMMCQLLRAYRQLFGASYFEVDAYQFGLNNPEGLKSGAFWFYYRHGFRPLDPALAALAERERAKMRRQPGYRSSERTLLRFTQSDVALNLEPRLPPNSYALLKPVTGMIARRYGGDRHTAELACMAAFEKATGRFGDMTEETRLFALEMALVAEANKITDPRRLKALRQQVDCRASDIYAYQRGWIDYFKQ
ncbi:MAG: hypothetical protein FGM18_09995 [Burkholderiaceae bacterium]|nr:hypothetical protein [Burkholderiaceae bacterium]